MNSDIVSPSAFVNMLGWSNCAEERESLCRMAIRNALGADADVSVQEDSPSGDLHVTISIEKAEIGQSDINNLRAFLAGVNDFAKADGWAVRSAELQTFSTVQLVNEGD